MKFMDRFVETPNGIKPHHLQKELKSMLTPREKVEEAYELTDNWFIFTDKRLIIRDTLPAEAGDIPTLSIPYRSITHFSLTPLQEESVGNRLTIWLSGDQEPIQKDLAVSPQIPELHQTLADYVLNKHSPWLNKQLILKRQSGLRTVQALGLTGAAVLSILYLKKSHGHKKAPAPADAFSTKALKQLIHHKLKG